MAVERVEHWLRQVTAALNAAGVEYAVVGGNAVASWVARSDPEAVRATKDVDVLIRRADSAGVIALIEGLGFIKEVIRGWVFFVDPATPSRRSGIHLIWANEKVWPSNLLPTPSVDESELDPEGYRVLSLPALVRMKLTSFREIDRAHLIDLISLGILDIGFRTQLPDSLHARFEAVLQSAREQDPFADNSNDSPGA